MKILFQHHRILFNIIFCGIMLISCTSAPPQDPDNICKIFKEKRIWYKAAKRTEDRWKLPP